MTVAHDEAAPPSGRVHRLELGLDLTVRMTLDTLDMDGAHVTFRTVIAAVFARLWQRRSRPSERGVCWSHSGVVSARSVVL